MSGETVVGADFGPKAVARGPADSRLKRALDIGLAVMALAFLSPLMILAALAVVLDSRVPALFVQRRTGLNGRRFGVYKFRTMTVMEDGDAIRHACRGDLRVTRVGRFLRRSSIDELPQLFNVIRGEMSLVGPRPHAVAHDEHYAERIPAYAERFRTRPGITGLAQVKGLRGDIRTLDCMVARIEADNAYVEQWSIGLDLKILARTLVVAPFQDTAF